MSWSAKSNIHEIYQNQFFENFERLFVASCAKTKGKCYIETANREIKQFSLQNKIPQKSCFSQPFSTKKYAN